MESTRHRPNQGEPTPSPSQARPSKPEQVAPRRDKADGQRQVSPMGPLPGGGIVVSPKQGSGAPMPPNRWARVSLADLPPVPQPVGIARLLARCFGGPLLPLRFFWLFARWLWLAVGLVVIGAGALDYLSKLFTGNLPNVTEAFESSPVLVIPSTHPLRFLAVMALVLALTVLAWGAAHEQRRRLDARAERVRQAIRAGMSVEEVDDEMRAALLAGATSGNFQLATYVHERNRAADAAWLYQLVLEKEPKHFGANYNLGLVYAELEQYDAAEGYCRTAVLLNSESAEGQGLTAYVLYRMGFLEEAQRRARLAVRMGFSSELLESLILPGLGVTSSMPALGSGEEIQW